MEQAELTPPEKIVDDDENQPRPLLSLGLSAYHRRSRSERRERNVSSGCRTFALARVKAGAAYSSLHHRAEMPWLRSSALSAALVNN